MGGSGAGRKGTGTLGTLMELLEDTLEEGLKEELRCKSEVAFSNDSFRFCNR